MKKKKNPFDLILNVYWLVGRPRSEALFDSVFNVSGDSSFELWGSEKPCDECVHFLMHGPVHFEYGLFSHQFSNRFWISRDEVGLVVLQNHLVHVLVSRYYDIASQNACLEHIPVPIHTKENDYII